MYDIFFYVFTIINFLALKNIYWPALKQHIDGLIALQTVLNNWQLVITAYLTCLIILTKQKWLKTAQYLNEDRYLITHVLNGKIVKFIVKPVDKKLKAVVDENYDECYFEEARPFFRYELEEFNPETIGLSKSLFIHFESDDLDSENVVRVSPKLDDTANAKNKNL